MFVQGVHRKQIATTLALSVSVFLSVVSPVLLVPTAVQAQAPRSKVSDIRVDTQSGRQVLMLNLTGSSTKPEVVSTMVGDAYVVDIREASLGIGDNRSFTLTKPSDKISSVEAQQMDARTVRVTVKGMGGIAPKLSLMETLPTSLRFDIGPSGQIAQGNATADVAARRPENRESTTTVSTPADLKQPDRYGETGPRKFSARAVAPPTGDVAIGDINVESAVKLNSPEIVNIERATVPTKAFLQILARRAGYNIMFAPDVTEATVTMDLKQAPVEDAFNLVLRLSNLKARLIDKNILVGATLPKDLIQTSVRTFRLNQADVATVVPQITQLSTQLNEDLFVQPDTRTNSVTLVGTARALKVAAAQISQLDVRQRQVLLAVKLVDIDLNDNENLGINIGSSLGQLNVGTFSNSGFGGSTGFITFPPPPAPTGGTAAATGQTFQLGAPLPPGPYTGGAPTVTSVDLSSTFAPSGVADKFAAVFDGTSANILRAIQLRLEASIKSGRSKVLAEPRILVQASDSFNKGNSAKIDITDDVIVGTKIQVDPATGLTTSTVEKDKAGVVLKAEVFQIDDNGYVNVSLKPEISSITSSQRDAQNNIITLLTRRNLDIQKVRLRDGETFIIGGLLQNQDLTSTLKVPLLGDLPLIGSLFRIDSVQNRRREAVLMVTPHIMKDPVTSGQPTVSINPQ
jgi:type IV pilus assembly protein PilQ